MHVCNMHVCMYVCAYIHTYAHTHTHTYIHTIHTIHTYDYPMNRLWMPRASAQTQAYI